MSEISGTHDRGMREIVRRWPDATMNERPNGAMRVEVPRVALPDGLYQEAHTAVWFDLPVGFPVACPADFYTDPIRHSFGGQPSHTLPCEHGRLWWMHRLSSWSPQQDTAYNYLGSIRVRLSHPFQGVPADV